MENQYIEYKDYSNIKNTKSEINKIKDQIIKEVCALSNSGGGKIVIGKKDDGNDIVQPQFILDVFDNDRIANIVNSATSDLVVMESNVREGNAIIEIYDSIYVISVTRDSNEFNKGDIFIRKNAHCTKANSDEILKIHQRKESNSIASKLKKLNKIVHKKFTEGSPHARDFNVFDTLWIKLSSDKIQFKKIKYLFDHIAIHQFIFSLNMPFTEKFILQEYLTILDAIIFDSKGQHVKLIDLVRENNMIQQNIIDGYREKVINSKELDFYLAKYVFDWFC